MLQAGPRGVRPPAPGSSPPRSAAATRTARTRRARRCRTASRRPPASATAHDHRRQPERSSCSAARPGTTRSPPGTAPPRAPRPQPGSRPGHREPAPPGQPHHGAPAPQARPGPRRHHPQRTRCGTCRPGRRRWPTAGPRVPPSPRTPGHDAPRVQAAIALVLGAEPGAVTPDLDPAVPAQVPRRAQRVDFGRPHMRRPPVPHGPLRRTGPISLRHHRQARSDHRGQPASGRRPSAPRGHARVPKPEGMRIVSAPQLRLPRMRWARRARRPASAGRSG